MQGRAIVERFADLVPGVGLRLEATPDADALGIQPEQAEDWAQQVESSFDAFMRSKNFSLSEDMTGYQTQRFVTIQQQRDGEYFAQLSYTQRSGLNPLQVSFLDPSQIQGYPLTDTAGYHLTDYGINKDSRGREVSYNVRVYDPKNHTFEQRVIQRVGARSKRVLMLHGFQKEYAGQTRGYSRLGHILQQLENLTDFEFAHIKKAINESMVAMWIKPSKENPASDGGFTDGLSSAVGTFDPPDNPITEAEATVMPALDYSELNELNGRPGSWLNMGLQGGEELRTLDGKSPADNYNVFVDAFVKSLAASVSMPSEVVWMQFGENFSASRAALVLAWQVVEIWRNELAADYLNPIYEAWLSGEIAAGRISAPGWTDLRLREAWLKNSWVGFPMPNIDPSKTATAHEKYVSMGATTLDRVARELNGTSGKVNRAKLTREFKELPVSPFLKGGAPAEAPVKTKKQDKEDD
jgi:lambda family phage portal protein